MVTESFKKVAQNNTIMINCECCDYNTCKKSSWTKHILTAKHKKRLNGDTGDKKVAKSCPNICFTCNKVYKSRNGLWKHMKKCSNKIEKIIDTSIEKHNIIIMDDNNEFKQLIMEVVKSNQELQKQNQDFQKQMLEVCKNNNNTVIHNSNSHNNNKTFNLQVFLNEECKDAMNLTDFMNSFQLQLEDLEKVGTMGYVDGVSNIILKKLREMDVNKRPMHCSDAKREIMYIKEEDKWEKEGLNNLKLKKAITIIENKNIKLLGAWKEAHPKYMEYDEPDNDIYTHLIIQTMSNCDDFGNKVIKKLAKEVTIDK
jgi:hypothetical protein